MSEIEGRPFTDVLGELENGYLLHQLTDQIYELTRAVQDTRKAGTLKLELKLSPTGRGSVEIAASFAAKVPEHDRLTTTFFTTPEGALVRNDPNQANLPLREVPSDDDRPLRTVGE